MRGKIRLILLFLLLGTAVSGNNVRVTGVPKAKLNAARDSVALTFALSWDNSWRDEYNWDAVWVFVKWKLEGTTVAWGEVSRCGGAVVPAGLGCDSEPAGVMLYRSAPGTGPIIDQSVTLKFPCYGFTAAQVENQQICFTVTAIEMVLVPYGAFYLGDGAATASFAAIGIPENRDLIGTDPSYTYSASSVYGNNMSAFGPQNAANRRMGGNNWHSVVGGTTEWWMVDFGEKKTIRMFSVGGGGSAENWFLEGSNTLDDWHVLWEGEKKYWIGNYYPIRDVICINESNDAYQYYRVRSPKSSNYFYIYNISMSEQLTLAGALISNEDAVTVQEKGHGNKTIPDAFRKGYKGFYTMKYELSQEQYVNYLNMLSVTDQKLRIGNALDGLKQGDYVFGSKARADSRNGIALYANNGESAPAVFGCNLNPDDPFNSTADGQTIACNYLTSADLEAYCTWSGFRPMSELEYEKASRPSNQPPLAGEYAWNSTVLKALKGAGDLTSGSVGSESELPTSLDVNANADNTFGPVRCGSFSSAGTSQQQAGSSYWGVMELSGNVAELYQQVEGGYTLRGGSFASEPTRLQTSDRSLLSVAATRDSTVGFRAARNLLIRPLNGGTLTVQDGKTTACPGEPLKINGIEVASDIPVSYSWYVKVGSGTYTQIPDQTAVSLTYDQIVNTTTASLIYYFKRKAFTVLGEVWNEVQVTVPNTAVTFTPASASLDACGNTLAVTATPVMKDVTSTYTWLYNGKPIPGVSGNTYTASAGHFGGNTGDLNVICVATIKDCSAQKELSVSIADPYPVVSQSEVTLSNCGSVSFYDKRDGDTKTYCTVKIGDQCWMGANLNVGTYSPNSKINDYTILTTPIWTFNKYGIQKWCKLADCAIFGGLYEWWEVVCGGYCTKGVTPSNAESLEVRDEADLANKVGITLVNGKIQGICPAGWHVPTKVEWETLKTTLGPSAGTKMKKPGIYPGVSPREWCTDADCNSSGFNALPGVDMYNSGSNYVSSGVYECFWSSTPHTIDAGRRYVNMWRLSTSSYLDMEYSYRPFGYSVRCVLN